MTFTWQPSFEATERNKPRVRKSSLGDGYEQRLSFGLNTNPREWSLTFSERSDAERDAILAYLEARNGVESFNWTTPRGLTAKFVCEEWDTVLRSCNFNTVTAVFRQTFEP